MSFIISDLNELHKKLLYIKDNLVKLGPDRRQKELGFTKFNEAKLEYAKLEYILAQVHNLVEKSEVSTKDITLINKIANDIQIIYDKIISLETLSVSSISKMAEKDKFDLKTAIALLPTMTGQEHVTKSLIDGIQLYSSMISDATHGLLIDFVIKTRLSPSAKLRLKSSYPTIKDLIRDMNTHLIQKKSAVAIQHKLQNCRQGHRSIESFGSELEQLFVNLTIAQADDDATKFEVLRPINEKVAIKRFSDGLVNQKLSTIIASRHFDSLPEAIRTALDEQSMSTRHEEVMNIKKFHTRNFSRTPTNYPRQPSNYSNKYSYYNRFSANNRYAAGNTRPQQGKYMSRDSRAAQGTQSRSRDRGRPSPRPPRSAVPFQRVQYASHEQSTNSESQARSEPQNDNNLDFFRSY